MSTPTDGPVRRGRPAAPDTATLIQEVALELFSQHGYDGTSLREIADRLGVTKAALYYHYRTKDDILVAIVDPIAVEMEQLLSSGTEVAVRTPARQRQFLEDYLELLLRHRALITYLVNDVAALLASTVGERLRDLDRHLQAVFTDGGAPLADRVRTSAAVGALQAGLIAFPDAPAEELREPLLVAACGALGIRPPRAH